jgi:hypothetical protein
VQQRRVRQQRLEKPRRRHHRNGWRSPATDSATRATIEHDVAQKELQAAIAAAARAEQGDHATLVALAAAEERVATTAAVARRSAEGSRTRLAAGDDLDAFEAEAALQSELALKSAADAALLFGTNQSRSRRSGVLDAGGQGNHRPRRRRDRHQHAASPSRFVAELPGVGPLLEAAFSGVALLVLIQLLVEGAEKLSEFVSETYIYTEAMKEEYEQQVELNKEIEKSADNVKKLKEAYELIGASPVEKDIIEFQRLDKQVEDTKRSIESFENFIALYGIAASTPTATRSPTSRSQKPSVTSPSCRRCSRNTSRSARMS